MQNMQTPLKPSLIPFSFLIIFFLFSLHLPFSANATCNSDDLKALLEIKEYFGSDLSAFNTWDPSVDCCEWRYVGCTDGRVLSLTLKLSTNSDSVFEIPSVIENLTMLTTFTLKVSPGNLTGPIPRAIAHLYDLQHLDLHGNSLTGPVPGFLGQLESLKFIDLSSNQLSGPIPQTLGFLTKVITLRLAKNQLTGLIPANLAQITTLVKLDLSSNQLNGTIPDSLGSLTKLKVFNVSNNELCGQIPSGLSGFSVSSFENNKCLCGEPLDPCNDLNVVPVNKLIKQVIPLVE